MKRGFPRPRTFVEKTSTNPYSNTSTGSYGRKWDNRSYPHPYSAAEDAISVISNSRLRECITFKLCLNCGEVVEEEDVGLVIYNPRSRVKGIRANWIHSETGPFHLKCLIMTMTMCPHIARGKVFEAAYGNWKDVRPEIMKAAGMA